MKAPDLFQLAGRNLREAFLRNSLTTAGIAVGVASLVAMLSLGIGLQKVANKQLGRSGLFDTIIVNSRQDFRNQEDRRTNKVVQSSELKSLDDAARKDFETIPGVMEVYPDIRLMGELRFQADAAKPERSHFTNVSALPLSSRVSEVFDELKGSFFSGPTAEEVIIVADFGRELLGLPGGRDREDKLTQEQLDQLLGKQITLRYAVRRTAETGAGPGDVAAAMGGDAEAAANMFGFSVERQEKRFKIVGVVESEPFGGMRAASRARIFMPTPLAESMNPVQQTDFRSLMRPSQGKSYFTLIVRVDKTGNVAATQDAIRKRGFTTFSMLDASKGMTRFFTILDMFLGIFGSLALAVASLGIINTLFMAILERRREIGIMKAIGASDIDIKKLFFVEAGAMGAMGGLLGVALGWAIGRLINVASDVYMRRNDIPPENFWFVPWWLVAGAFAFAVVVSLGAGLVPASRAAKLDPVQALRHD